MYVCESIKCTGCFACMNICPIDAINVVLDDFGKTITQIDANKCVNCDMCKKVCPVNFPVKKVIPSIVIAAQSKIEQDLHNSASGGIATVLSKQCVSEDGIVFGAAFSEKCVKHLSANTYEQLENFRGSKYVQSYIGYSYRECLQKLRAGKKLLYFGTPCQIAGLENFLGNTDKSNLVTIDLICLGVPPFSYLKEYADFVTNNSWDNIEFRGKYGWNFTALNGGKIEYQRRHNYDLYYRPFSEALIFRDCCYQCEYSCSERCSDITIGDFWGLDKSTLNSSFKGEKISLVLLNTEKGKAFFEKSKSELTYEYRDLSEAIHPNQLALNHPAQPHNDREIFLENYTKLGYYSAVSKTHLAKNIKKDYFIFKIMDCKLVRLLRKIKRIVIK